MKIALLAPIEESMPPTYYGGTETVLATLAEGLYQQGHEVTVFGTGDSKVSCRLVPLVPKAIGSGNSKRIREAKTYEALAKVIQLLRVEQFDVVHNHIGWQALLFRNLIPWPFVSTIHWTLNDDVEHEMYGHYKKLPFVSISDAQRKDLPRLNYVATIHHGLNLDNLPFVKDPDDYLVFFGRLSPAKGPVEAIKVAKATGQRLIMGGKVNSFEQEFFDKEIKPHLDGKQISFVGELDDIQKAKLLGRAKALLSPIQWDEPFGLVNIEAMACGTPVISMSRGSLPEIVVNKKTGFLCRTEAQLIKAVQSIDQIKRQDCRTHIVTNFSAKYMVQRYIDAYSQIIAVRERDARALVSRLV